MRGSRGVGLTVLASMLVAAVACSSSGGGSSGADGGASLEDATVGGDAAVGDDGSSSGDATLASDASEGGSGDDAAVVDGNTGIDAADASSAVVSAVVGPVGATLIHPLGAVLVVPAGALAAPTLVTLGSIAAPAGADVIGGAFQVGPSGLTFSSPASLTLSYVAGEVPDGSAASALAIEQSTDDGATFSALSSTENGTNGTVSASTLGAGQFAPILVTGGALFVTTSSPLTSGNVGAAYSTTLAATGGTTPYSWSVASGSSVPAGLGLTSGGVLSGMPTTVGHYAFVVRVADSTAHVTQASFGMDVAPALNPAPTLTSLAPSHAMADNDVSVTVTGTGFVPSTTIDVGSTSVATTWVSSTEVVAQIPYTAIPTAGPYAITATSPTPGGGTSSALTFTADAVSYPVPTLTSLSPTHAYENNDVDVTLTGTGFYQWTTAQIGTSAVPVTWVSATQLVAHVPGSDLPTASTYAITVINPSPGGGTSNAQTFTADLYNPSPTITSLSPSSTPAGSPDTQVTVTGTGFIASSVVQVNTSAVSSSYVSATELLALIPAADVADAGVLQVVVQNPAPGGGASATASFLVGGTISGAPVVTGVSPDAVEAGAPVTITVTGSGFVERNYSNVCSLGGYVLFDGTAINTTYVSSTQVTGYVIPALLQSAHTATVTYLNPPGDAGAGAAGNTVPLVVTPLTTSCASCPSSTICQNGVCCFPPGDYSGEEYPCCSGLGLAINPSEIQCLSTCTAVGSQPPYSAVTGGSVATDCCTSNMALCSNTWVCE